MQIFISYHHTDEDFAEVLRARVNADTSMAAWTFKQRLRAGDDWRLEIDHAIRTSAVLVHVITPEAATSRYVTYEWAYAMGLGIPIVPVLLRETELHPKLSALQHLDFTRTSHRPWSALLRDLKAQAGRRAMLDRDLEERMRTTPVAWPDVDAVSRLLGALLGDSRTAHWALREQELKDDKGSE